MIKVSTICSPFVSRTAPFSVRQANPCLAAPEGFALIRLLYGGICNTDLELQRGYYGFRGTPGHEFVGEVVEADDQRLDRPARGGRNQSSLRKMRMVRSRVGTPLPEAHGARNCQTARRVPRIPDVARAQSAAECRARFHLSKPCLSSRLAAACEILDQVRIPRGHARGRAGRWKAGAACQPGS